MFWHLQIGQATGSILIRHASDYLQVPTAVAYRHDGVVLWGFQTQDVFNDEIEEAEVHDWFAIYLDKLEHSRATHQAFGDIPPLHEDVRKYFRDFLHKLYLHIRISISSTVPSLDWEQCTVEFLFSPPTTWAIDTLEDMCRLAREAGFGSESRKHSVVLGVTEAEATAVYSFRTQAGCYKVCTQELETCGDSLSPDWRPDPCRGCW